MGDFSKTAQVKGEVTGYGKSGLEKEMKLIYTRGNESELICETVLKEITLKK